MTVLFEYDSRHRATKAIDPPADWVRVVKRRQEMVVGDHVLKGHADISGQFAGREPPGAVFHLLVWPEDGEPFTVDDCQVVNDYGGYGEDTRIYDFVAKELRLDVDVRAQTAVGTMEMKYPLSKLEGKYASVSMGCHVDEPKCVFCGQEPPEDPGGQLCKHCQVKVVETEISHQSGASIVMRALDQMTRLVVEIPDSVCGPVGQITGFGPTGKRPPRVYEMSSGARDYVPGRLCVPEDGECNCDQALTYLAMIRALATTASDELRRCALDTVGRWERDHPDVDLAARLKTLEDK
jgi:hypothetical protein